MNELFTGRTCGSDGSPANVNTPVTAIDVIEALPAVPSQNTVTFNVARVLAATLPKLTAEGEIDILGGLIGGPGGNILCRRHVRNTPQRPIWVLDINPRRVVEVVDPD